MLSGAVEAETAGEAARGKSIFRLPTTLRSSGADCVGGGQNGLLTFEFPAKMLAR